MAGNKFRKSVPTDAIILALVASANSAKKALLAQFSHVSPKSELDSLSKFLLHREVEVYVRDVDTLAADILSTRQ